MQITVYRAKALGYYGEYFPSRAEAVASLVGLLSGNGLVEFGHPAYWAGKLNCHPAIENDEVDFQSVEVASDCVGIWSVLPPEMIKEIQKDAYNSALVDVKAVMPGNPCPNRREDVANAISGLRK